MFSGLRSCFDEGRHIKSEAVRDQLSGKWRFVSFSLSLSVYYFSLVSLRDAPEHSAFITLTAAHPIGDSEGVDVFQRRNDARKVKPSVVDLESTSSSAR